MIVYRGMDKKFFSYSGPTSMGKSFVVQTYVQEQVKNGSTENYAILVPTKALINEVKSNLIGALQEVLKEKNYRVVTAAGDLVLQQDHHFIFVMTPERLHHMMIERENIHIDFLFIDEAHKISAPRRQKHILFQGNDSTAKNAAASYDCAGFSKYSESGSISENYTGRRVWRDEQVGISVRSCLPVQVLLGYPFPERLFL